MSGIKYNFHLCNINGLRCVHCCTLDYRQPLEHYEDLFRTRRETFNRLVVNFPEDVPAYCAEIPPRPDDAITPCIYLGMVDDNPGCLLHPLLHDGIDVRGDELLTGHVCSPDYGCFFHVYTHSQKGRKLGLEMVGDAQNWYEYSKALFDFGILNREWGYIIKRIPLEQLSVQIVQNAQLAIQSKFSQHFPPTPDAHATSSYMDASTKFKKWGLRFGVVNDRPVKLIASEGDIDPRLLEWSVYQHPTETRLFVYRPLGEVLPFHFPHIAIASDEQVEAALAIVDKTLEELVG